MRSQKSRLAKALPLCFRKDLLSRILGDILGSLPSDTVCQLYRWLLHIKVLVSLLVYWENIYRSARSVCITLKCAGLRAYLHVWETAFCWLKFLYLLAWFCLYFLSLLYARLIASLLCSHGCPSTPDPPPRQEPPSLVFLFSNSYPYFFSVIVNRDTMVCLGGQSKNIALRVLMVSHSREWRSGDRLLSVKVGRWDVVVALGRRKLFGTADVG